MLWYTSPVRESLFALLTGDKKLACHTFGKKPLFTREEVDSAASSGRLLSMEIEFSRRCNFRCPYCYLVSDDDLENEMTDEESRQVILQAKELGARRIIILGGEPMIYPTIMEQIAFIKDNGMAVEVFTNGSRMTPGRARQLAAMDVKVVLKMNTMKEDLQNCMAGHPHAYNIIQDAFTCLLDAGYGPGGRPMAVSTVISDQNIDELREMWCWLRDKNIDPYFEIITPQGCAIENHWVYDDMDKIETLFQDLADIDKEKYGYDWSPQPPLVGDQCLRHLFSCVVTSTGDVWPCVGIDFPVGNVRTTPLARIIKDSEVLQDLRAYRETIKGPCAMCDKRNDCYGCRGAAYQLTGDYLASDPSCWRNKQKLNDIERLPVSVEPYVPHRKPMLLVDKLLTIRERRAEVESVVHDENPFLNDQGTMDNAAFMEIMAQSIAALNGYQLRHKTASSLGFLMGARNIRVYGSARIGDRLVTSVYKEHKLDDIGVIKGAVYKDGECLAEGEIKVYHKTDESE